MPNNKILKIQTSSTSEKRNLFFDAEVLPIQIIELLKINHHATTKTDQEFYDSLIIDIGKILTIKHFHEFPFYVDRILPTTHNKFLVLYLDGSAIQKEEVDLARLSCDDKHKNDFKTLMTECVDFNAIRAEFLSETENMQPPLFMRPQNNLYDHTLIEIKKYEKNFQEKYDEYIKKHKDNICEGKITIQPQPKVKPKLPKEFSLSDYSLLEAARLFHFENFIQVMDEFHFCKTKMKELLDKKQALQNDANANNNTRLVDYIETAWKQFDHQCSLTAKINAKDNEIKRLVNAIQHDFAKAFVHCLNIREHQYYLMQYITWIMYQSLPENFSINIDKTSFLELEKNISQLLSNAFNTNWVKNSDKQKNIIDKINQDAEEIQKTLNISFAPFNAWRKNVLLLKPAGFAWSEHTKQNYDKKFFQIINEVKQKIATDKEYQAIKPNSLNPLTIYIEKNLLLEFEKQFEQEFIGKIKHQKTLIDMQLQAEKISNKLIDKNEIINLENEILNRLASFSEVKRDLITNKENYNEFILHVEKLSKKIQNEIKIIPMLKKELDSINLDNSAEKEREKLLLAKTHTLEDMERYCKNMLDIHQTLTQIKINIDRAQKWDELTSFQIELATIYQTMGNNLTSIVDKINLYSELHTELNEFLHQYNELRIQVGNLQNELKEINNINDNLPNKIEEAKKILSFNQAEGATLFNTMELIAFITHCYKTIEHDFVVDFELYSTTYPNDIELSIQISQFLLNKKYFEALYKRSYHDILKNPPEMKTVKEAFQGTQLQYQQIQTRFVKLQQEVREEALRDNKSENEVVQLDQRHAAILTTEITESSKKGFDFLKQHWKKIAIGIAITLAVVGMIALSIVTLGLSQTLVIAVGAAATGHVALTGNGIAIAGALALAGSGIIAVGLLACTMANRFKNWIKKSPQTKIETKQTTVKILEKTEKTTRELKIDHPLMPLANSPSASKKFNYDQSKKSGVAAFTFMNKSNSSAYTVKEVAISSPPTLRTVL